MIYGLWYSDDDDDDDDGYGACDAYLLPPVSPNCGEGAPSGGGQESRGGAGKEMESGKCKMYSCTCRTCTLYIGKEMEDGTSCTCARRGAAQPGWRRQGGARVPY